MSLDGFVAIFRPYPVYIYIWCMTPLIMTPIHNILQNSKFDIRFQKPF